MPIAPAAGGYARTWRWTTRCAARGLARAFVRRRELAGGPGRFRHARTPGAIVRTSWNTEDIWLRRHFTLDALPKGALALWIHHDEDVEVYLNGAPIASLAGYRNGYGLVRLDPSAREHLLQGDDVLAVHCHQTNGGQYVDVGLVEVLEDGR